MGWISFLLSMNLCLLQLCAAEILLGDSCSTSEDCLSGSRCDEQSCKKEIQLNGDCSSADTVCVRELVCETGQSQDEPSTCKIAMGDPCSSSTECQSGSRCDEKLCKREVSLNEDCSTVLRICAEGLMCEAAATQNEPDVCKTMVGERCGASTDCQSGTRCEEEQCKTEVAVNGGCSATNTVCAAGLTCEVGTSQDDGPPSTCKTLVGETCIASEDCQTSSQCDQNICKRVVALNGDCGAASTICAADLTCEAGETRVCKKKVGEPCSTSVDCQTGSRCDDLQCKKESALNEVCEWDNLVCAKGMMCQFIGSNISPGTCKMDNGGSCTTSADCQSNSTCDQLTCKIELPLNENCGETTTACASGLVCEAGATQDDPSVCKIMVGGECSTTADCQSSSRCDNELCNKEVSLNEDCSEVNTLCAAGLTCEPDASNSDLPSVCKAITGQSCNHSTECQSGHGCDQQVCKTQVALNGDCSETNTVCAMGLTCEPQGEPRVCKILAGGDCTVSTECQSSSVCHEHTCKNELPLNGDCGAANTMCAPNLVCEMDTSDDSSGACKLPLTSSCENSQNDCVRSAVCQDGVCKSLGGVGESCGADDNTVCDNGLSCEADVCKAGVGESCNTIGDCQGNAVCNEHTCRLPVSSDCTDHRDMCVSTAVCYGNQCKTVLSVDGDCSGSASAVCGPGLTCEAGATPTEPSLCKVLLGETCNSKNQCQREATCDQSMCRLPLSANCRDNERDCVKGTTCDNGNCKLKVAEDCSGERWDKCKTGALCENGACMLTVNSPCPAEEVEGTDGCIEDAVCENALCKIQAERECSGSNQCVKDALCTGSNPRTCSCNAGYKKLQTGICSSAERIISRTLLVTALLVLCRLV